MEMNGNGMSEGTLTASQSMDSVNATPEDEVRTLFVSGLPVDVRSRELYLLFRAYKGYESSMLKVSTKNMKNSGPVGFVTFQTRQDAEAVKKELQGVKFDPDGQQTIRLEFAKSNTKMINTKSSHLKHSPPATGLPTFLHPFTPPDLVAPLITNGTELWNPLAAYAAAAAELNPQTTSILSVHPLLQHLQTAGLNNALQYAPLTAAAFYGGAPAILQPNQHHQALNSSMVGSQPGAAAATLAAALAVAQQQQQQATVALNGHHSSGLLQNGHHNWRSIGGSSSSLTSIGGGHLGGPSQPCSTLFVANLSPNVSEQELRDIFGLFAGFTRIRLSIKQSNAPVAFVEFSDVKLATQAMISLQGSVLTSSDRGGIRIEYAKHRMGENKKDDHSLRNSPLTLPLH